MKCVFIVADSVRHDAFGCLGGTVKTPTVDRISSQGTVFERTISAAPWTVPSIASMLTGVYAHRMGLAKWEQPWPSQFLSLFDCAAKKGMKVASFVFDLRHLFRRVTSANVAGSSQDTTLLHEWLRSNRHEPYILFIHYWWTHIPYVDKPMTIRAWRQTTDKLLASLRKGETVKAGVRQLYNRAIHRFSEHWLAQLLKEFDPDDTWMVLTADHGESWGEREETASLGCVFDLHGNHLYDEVLRVPLIVRPPGGQKKPHRIKSLTRTVDIAPTLCELLELDALESIDGVSLASSVRNGDPPKEKMHALSVMSADYVDMPELPTSPLDLWKGFSLTTDRYKIIHFPGVDRTLAFDLNKDPYEKRNILKEKQTLLEPYLSQIKSEISKATVGEWLPDDAELVRKRLRKLGYLE